MARTAQAPSASSDQSAARQETASQFAGGLQAMNMSSRILASGWAELMQNWLDFMERSTVSQTRLVRDVFYLSTMRHVLQAQRAFLEDNLRNLAESTGSALRTSGTIAERAARPIEEIAGNGNGRGSSSNHERAGRQSAQRSRPADGGETRARMREAQLD